MSLLWASGESQLFNWLGSTNQWRHSMKESGAANTTVSQLSPSPSLSLWRGPQTGRESTLNPIISHITLIPSISKPVRTIWKHYLCVGSGDRYLKFITSLDSSFYSKMVVSVFMFDFNTFSLTSLDQRCRLFGCRAALLGMLVLAKQPTSYNVLMMRW